MKYSIEKNLIKAIEDYFMAKYNELITDGKIHEEAINLSQKAVYEAVDSVAVGKHIRVVTAERSGRTGFAIYARYGNENQLDGKGENK